MNPDAERGRRVGDRLGDVRRPDHTPSRSRAAPDRDDRAATADPAAGGHRATTPTAPPGQSVDPLRQTPPEQGGTHDRDHRPQAGAPRDLGLRRLRRGGRAHRRGTAQHLLGRVTLAPGDTVLDVAAGTGNVAIPAARMGATVVGLDLTPELFTVARRACRAGRRAGRLGARATPRSSVPRRVLPHGPVGLRRAVRAAPLGRRARAGPVCRPGGRIGLVNWTPEGFIGQLFKSSALPAALPDYSSAPPLFGNEAQSARCSPAPVWSGRSSAATTPGTSARPRT